MNAALSPLTPITAQPGSGGRASPPSFPWPGEQRGLNPRTALHPPQGHWAPSSEASGTSVTLERLPFCLFPLLPRQASCSLLRKRKHPEQFADANSRLPAELCLMALRGLRFLLGTFRYSSAVFFLPRRDPGEAVCSCLMALPFAHLPLPPVPSLCS